MQIKNYFEKLEYAGIAVLLVIAVILAVFYNLVIPQFNIFFSIIAMVLAVFGSFYIFRSFFEEEKPVELAAGEKMIIRTLDRGYILLPNKPGGFMSRKSQRDLNIYLTNRRILGRKSSGEYVFDTPLSAVSKVMPEKRLLAKYLRVRYLDKGKEKDALLFVGSQGIDLWLKRLAQLGIKETDEFESTIESTEEGFVEDATSLQNKVARKK